MAEKEFRQDGENSQSGRDGYKSYNREGYNKYGRGEKSNSYGRRPYNNNREGGEGYRSSYNPRFNSGEDRPQRGGYGNRPQRSYGNRSYNNEGGEQRSSYNPRFNNNNGGRPQRAYTPRFNNNQEGGEQRSYRPRFNNAQQGGEQRPYRPRFNNNGGQQGGYGRPQGGYRPRTADYNPNAKYSMKKQIEYKGLLTDPDEPIRLNKFLANAGICSRREADEFITAGVVSVNGEVVTENRTSGMLFTLGELVAKISEDAYLNPGDFIGLGTSPEGNATCSKLGRWLEVGDEIEFSIEKIGTICNKVVE